MAVSIEIRYGDNLAMTIPFESVPRIGEKIQTLTGPNGGPEMWKVVDVIHYQADRDYQASVVVERI